MGKQAISQLAVGALLCVPALALRGDEKQDLREELVRNADCTTAFKGIQRRLGAGDPKALAELIAACDAAPADASKAEAELAQLRLRINALQEILDARALWAAEVASAAKGAAAPSAPIATGESSRLVDVNAVATSADAGSAVDAAAGTKTAFESLEFVADRARLGRVCWRGGRYLEGVAALEPLAGEPVADYWRARCLEKLARNGEALELYKHVIEIAGESPEGRCAREDREFLEWSIGHGLECTP